jgi:SsrA-binding protein
VRSLAVLPGAFPASPIRDERSRNQRVARFGRVDLRSFRSPSLRS